jgi:hypothetical protein
MPHSLTIIIVDKTGTLKTLNIKDYKVEELYKKCGFKKSENFCLQTEWNVTLNGQKYLIQMYGKLEGKSGSENKYDFPPPVDTKLYFGSCALVGLTNTTTHINLSLDLWNKIYEKLFGGFEDLSTTCKEDEEEDDELEKIPKHMKTKKGGYLKDGFVVDSSDTEETDEDFCGEDDADDVDIGDENSNSDNENMDDELKLMEIGSELSEESYDE